MDVKDSCLIAELFSANIINQEEKDELDSVESETHKLEKLLSLLSKKSADKFQQFLSVLERTGQQNIADRIRGVTTPGMTGFDVRFYCLTAKLTFCRAVTTFYSVYERHTSRHLILYRSDASLINSLTRLI